MARPPFPDDVRRLLERPNPAVIATLRADGHPVSVATWYAMEGDQVLVNMDEGRRRLDHLRADPRVSLTVLAEDWYTHVSLFGRVARMYDDEGLVDMERAMPGYTGAIEAGALARLGCDPPAVTQSRRSTAATVTTAVPASSEAARSTTALMPQSWCPAGSSNT